MGGFKCPFYFPEEVKGTFYLYLIKRHYQEEPVTAGNTMTYGISQPLAFITPTPAAAPVSISVNPAFAAFKVGSKTFTDVLTSSPALIILVTL